MKDSIFIFFTIFITTSLIYFVYKIMLGVDKNSKDTELQITSNEILEELNILYKQKKYNIVESLAKSYLQKKGGNDNVRIILAKALYNSKKIYEAIDQIKVVIKHQPNNQDNRIFLANCYLSVSNPMKAISVFEEILEFDPENIIAVKELADAYFNSNRKPSALKMYKKLDGFLENNQELRLNKMKIAEIHIELGEFDFAIEEYNKILEMYPDDIRAKKRLIELYRQVSDTDKVIAMAHELASYYANDLDGLWAMNILMELYHSLKDYDRALEFANAIRNHNMSDKISAGENIAKLLLEKEQVEESIDILKSLIEQDPTNIKLKKSLSNAYKKKNDFVTATFIYKKILDDADIQDIEKINFEISNLYAEWGMYLFSEGDNDECFKRFTTALQYYEKNPEIYYTIGNINKQIRNINEAISQYKRAIELNPQNVYYYYAIAECYEEIDSIYEQKKILSESLKYNTDNSFVYYKLGLIYQSQNDSNAAIQNLQKAIDIDDNFVDAKYKLALLFEHVGKKEEAIRLYEEILAVNPENQEIINNLKMMRS